MDKLDAHTIAIIMDIANKIKEEIHKKAKRINMCTRYSTPQVRESLALLTIDKCIEEYTGVPMRNTNTFTICNNCIHYNVCGEENARDPAITYCADYLSVEDIKNNTIKSNTIECDRNICISNEYNGIGCDECEITKANKKEDYISRMEEHD